MLQGHEVIVADNFFTGRKRNVEHWLGHDNFELIHHDIVHPLHLEGSDRVKHRVEREIFRLLVDQIYHLASPASPPHYMYNPVKTIKVKLRRNDQHVRWVDDGSSLERSFVIWNGAGLARRVRARLLFASTSEVYGDPEVHPQRETYFGNVNPFGPRSCYDESKRVGEAMCYAYAQQVRRRDERNT